MRHSLKRVKYIIISVNHQNEDRTREEFWRFSPIAIGSFMLRVFSFLFLSFTHSTRQQEINYSCTIIIFFFSLCLDKKKTVSLTHIRQVFFVFECHKSFFFFLFPDWPSSLLQRKEIFRVVGSFFFFFFRLFSLLPVWVAYFVALTFHVYLCVCQFVCVL